VYHVNMPLSCIDLFRLNASFIRGFILSECSLQGHFANVCVEHWIHNK
jgi:hypothetical protein